MKRTHMLKRAFTLTELAITIFVIAILIAVMIPVFSNIINKAKLSNDKTAVKNFNTALFISETADGTPKNVIEAVNVLMCEYSYSDLTLKSSRLVYNKKTNRMLIFSTDFKNLLYSETGSISEVAAFGKQAAKHKITAEGNVDNYDDYCVIGTEDMQTAIYEGFTDFYVYNTESTVTIDSTTVQEDNSVTVWVYSTESADVIIENAVVYYQYEDEEVVVFNSTEDDGETTHTHTYDICKTIKEATCEEDGINYLYCSCGEYIEETVEKLGHSYTATNVVCATVDSMGYTEYTCSTCGDKYSGDKKPYLCTDGLKFSKSQDSDGSYYYTVEGIEGTSGDIYIPSYYKGSSDDDYIVVKEIAKEAFTSNTYITSVQMGATITTIGESAFSNCTSLKTVNIPRDVTTLSKQCFYWCTGLEYIYYQAESANEPDTHTFAKAGSESGGVALYIDKNVKTIPNGLFNCTNEAYYSYLKSIIFEEGSVCTSIGTYAFRISPYLTTLVLPNTIDSCSNAISLISNVSLKSDVTLYFMGTKEQWQENALSQLFFVKKYVKTIYYYSDTYAESCWHYVNGKIELYT